MSQCSCQVHISKFVSHHFEIQLCIGYGHCARLDSKLKWDEDGEEKYCKVILKEISKVVLVLAS